MKQHYSEADLLETYYTQPGESMPVMMHLAECSECAARYERLERKVRGLAACEHDQPETFWARQRISIMRKVEGQRRTPVMRYAAAAILAFVLGGSIVLQRSNVAQAPGEPIQRAQISIESHDALDPWQSEELKDFQPVVAWESWVDAETKGTGDQS